MPKGKKFWQFRNAADKAVELLLYGNISETSWYKDEVSPRQFAEELAEQGPLDKIVVRINSGGGDVFAAQAIGNLLEECPAEVTAKIDGLCASAATIVACHCGKVIAANDSSYMVHPVRIGAYGYYDAKELREFLDALAVIKENIISLYAKKSGHTKDEVTNWMDATSWWTATTAKENGFVDELTGDETAVVENHNGLLFVNSINMGVPFDKAPDFVQSAKAATAAEGFVNKNCQKEDDNMAVEIKTVDDLRGAYPALVSEIEEAAAQNARNEERQRIQDIEDMSLPGSEDMTNEAKFTKPVSAADFAKAVVKNAKQRGEKFLTGAKNDADNSGMNGVEPGAGAFNGAEPDEFMAALKSVGAKK